jgi:hypothetical protein
MVDPPSRTNSIARQLSLKSWDIILAASGRHRPSLVLPVAAKPDEQSTAVIEGLSEASLHFSA